MLQSSHRPFGERIKHDQMKLHSCYDSDLNPSVIERNFDGTKLKKETNYKIMKNVDRF